jgi:RNA polymerase sigma factor FliA
LSVELSLRRPLIWCMGRVKGAEDAETVHPRQLRRAIGARKRKDTAMALICIHFVPRHMHPSRRRDFLERSILPLLLLNAAPLPSPHQTDEHIRVAAERSRREGRTESRKTPAQLYSLKRIAHKAAFARQFAKEKGLPKRQIEELGTSNTGLDACNKATAVSDEPVSLATDTLSNASGVEEPYRQMSAADLADRFGRSGADQRKARERDRLVMDALPLVRRAALKIHRRMPANIALDDLIGAGCVGLLEAMNRFDTRLHRSFAAYAGPRIYGAILDELRAMDYASRDLRRKGKQATEARRTLELRLGRAISESELAKELGVTLDAWHKTRWHLEAVRVSSWPPTDIQMSEGPVSESLMDAGFDPFEECYQSEIRRILRGARATLPGRLQNVIAWHYDKSLSFREIAKALGVTESRVSQLHSEALERVRRSVCRAMQGQADRP